MANMKIMMILTMMMVMMAITTKAIMRTVVAINSPTTMKIVMTMTIIHSENNEDNNYNYDNDGMIMVEPFAVHATVPYVLLRPDVLLRLRNSGK